MSKTNGSRAVGQSMKPLQQAFGVSSNPELDKVLAAMSADERAVLEAEQERTTYWVNELYQVARHEMANGWVQLNIRRRDGKPIFRDWRHFQKIKNQLVGEECEGIELYPAESRLVDANNKYHIWCNSDPDFRFPVGWHERDVRDDGHKARGLRQRPFVGTKPG